MIIDATHLILGRLASFSAKKALEGENVIIVNADKAIISGKKEDVVEKYKQRTERGDPLRGPYFPKTPDRLVRRAIRGMLPYKQEKGKRAFKRVMCYMGIPDEYKAQKMETLKQASISRLKISKYISVEELSRQLK